MHLLRLNTFFFFFDVFLLLRSSFHVPNLACRALCYYPVPYGSRDLQVFKKKKIKISARLF